MSAEFVILLGISSWLLVAAAMLWGMLRVVNRHARDAARDQHMPPVAVHKSPRRRPALLPALRAAQHFVHR